MKRGRGRRNHNRRARHIWRKTWLLSALAAAAILYGIVELRTGKEKTQDNAQVSAKMPPANPAAAEGLANDRDSGFGDSGEPEYLPQEWSIRVVDVNDTETVEIPAGWYQETDDASIRASLEKQAQENTGTVRAKACPSLHFCWCSYWAPAPVWAEAITSGDGSGLIPWI